MAGSGRRGRLLAAALATLLGAAPASGQVSSFVFAVYYPGASRALYAGYGVRRTFAFLGLEQNPATDYHEAVAGLGYRAPLGQGSQARIAVAAASASDGAYAKLLVLPFFVIRSAQLAATIEVYQPLQASGRRQLYLNPLTVTMPVYSRVRAGMAYSLAAAGGLRVQRFGPSVALEIPQGAITVSCLAGVAAANGRTRLTFSAAL